MRASGLAGRERDPRSAALWCFVCRLRRRIRESLLLILLSLDIGSFVFAIPAR